MREKCLSNCLEEAVKENMDAEQSKYDRHEEFVAQHNLGTSFRENRPVAEKVHEVQRLQDETKGYGRVRRLAPCPLY